ASRAARGGSVGLGLRSAPRPSILSRLPHLDPAKRHAEPTSSKGFVFSLRFLGRDRVPPPLPPPPRLPRLLRLLSHLVARILGQGFQGGGRGVRVARHRAPHFNTFGTGQGV